MLPKCVPFGWVCRGLAPQKQREATGWTRTKRASAARRGAEEEGAAEQESFRCKAAIRAAASAFRGRADPRARYPLLSSTSSPSARVRVVRGRVRVALSSRAPHHQSTTTTARAGEPCRLC